jgi:adenosylmethionine---8-amino-7-oxononanoate aminotransferase
MSARRDANAELVARDLACVWHPCTQMKDHEWLPLVPIRRGAGRVARGLQWPPLPRRHQLLVGEPVRPRQPGDRQRRAPPGRDLEHVMLAGFTHEPVVELSERLAGGHPRGADALLLRGQRLVGDRGRAENELPLLAQPAASPGGRRFVALENSYHGETLGALAIGDVALYKETYRPLLMDCLLAPSPDAYLREAGELAGGLARRQAAALDALLARYPGEVCAVVVEPLVQCAGSMRMYDPAYLVKLRALCDRHKVHLIADEIAVGFGRTGTCSPASRPASRRISCACRRASPAASCRCPWCSPHDEVYEAFYDDYGTLRAFLHSHSYTGNPLACAAALATLELFERATCWREPRARRH